MDGGGGGGFFSAGERLRCVLTNRADSFHGEVLFPGGKGEESKDANVYDALV